MDVIITFYYVLAGKLVLSGSSGIITMAFVEVFALRVPSGWNVSSIQGSNPDPISVFLQ